MLEITIGISVVLLITLYIYYKYVIFNFWRKNGVFYVKPVVPFGNLTEYLTRKLSLNEFFQKYYIKYKEHRLFGMYMFYKPCLIIADPDLIKIILTKEFASFHDHGVFCNENIDPLSGHLFNLPGKKWRNLRLKLTPTFTPGKIKQIFMVLQECGAELLKIVENKAHTENIIEMKEIFERYMMDVIMSTAFGIQSNCMTEPNNKYRYWGRKFFEMNPLWNAIFIFAPQILDFFSIPITDRGVTKFFTKIFQHNVEYRKKHNVIRHDFMNLLIQLIEKGYVESDDGKNTIDDSSNMNKLTILEATAQAYVFFLAGYETSSTTATYVLYELAQNQNIQDKVRQEIDETLEKHGGVTYNAVNKMTYLHKVIQESLRKYPPIGGLVRKCTKEIVIPTTNVRVPKGTSIAIPTFSIHRDPLIYPNPDKFDPERFNEDQVASRHPYAYLPFGEGPRICIGAKLGYMQIKIAIINLLAKFKFTLHPRTPVPITFDKASLILSSEGDVHFIIESR